MTNKKLMMMKGLPASGKSTYAKTLVEQGYKRVNKDELRLMIDGGKWTRNNEKLIRTVEKALVSAFLASGNNVVVDDTNFAYEAEWKSVAAEFGAEFEVKFFDTPVMECVDRDSVRGDKSVGAKVIMGMYSTYLKPKPVAYDSSLTDAYIFDVDGTLALMDGRSPYDYSKVATDKPNPAVIKILNDLRKANPSVTIIVLSGRDGSCFDATIKWLAENNIRPDFVGMRDAGDSRSDVIIKKEMYDTYINGKFNVMGVFDDRDRVVDLWRSLGLPTFQVAYGKF